MTTTALSERGDRLVTERSKAESYWQPVPANGFVEVLLAPHMVGMANPLAIGTQTVPPGSFVREHAHDRNEEVIYVLSGRGTAVLEDGEEAMEPGRLFFFGCNRPHKFVNAGDVDLTFLWVMVPSGLEGFFEAIGRKRRAGEATPPNFPRPDNILEIEAKTVYSSALTPDAR